MPNLDVVIPTIGRASLELSVASCYGSEFVNNIFVICDPSCFEQTKAICEGFSSLQIVLVESSAAPTPRNRGLNLVRSDFVVLLDADDEFMLTHTRTDELESLMDEQDCIGLSGSAKIFSKKSFRINSKGDRKIMLRHLILKNAIGTTSSTFLKVKCLKSHGIEFSANFICRQDFDLWIKCMSRGFYFRTSKTISLIYNDGGNVERISKQNMVKNFFAFALCLLAIVI